MAKSAKSILIYLSMKNNGDWESIYHDIESKASIKDIDIEKIVNSLTCNAITILDDDYPQYLRQCFRPPFVLYYLGDLSLIKEINNNLAVVGSRENSEYGRQATVDIVKDACRDYVIVSGGAIGIDTIAHQTALNNGGKTIAIMPCGFDNLYPKRNQLMFKKIQQNGLILSEYPPNVKPNPTLFPHRNRLISYFAEGVLVTEAYKCSGTLITVNFSLENNRDIMCVPYPYNSKSECNNLIKEGAFLVESANDVREILSRHKN